MFLSETLLRVGCFDWNRALFKKLKESNEYAHVHALICQQNLQFLPLIPLCPIPIIHVRATALAYIVQSRTRFRDTSARTTRTVGAWNNIVCQPILSSFLKIQCGHEGKCIRCFEADFIASIAWKVRKCL